MLAPRLSIPKRAVWATAALFCLNGLAEGQEAAASGESSSALTMQAWSAFERQDYPAARVAIERCQSLYGAQAVEMQGKLTALPDTENGHQAWALNDVGTCTFVLGKVAEAEGKRTRPRRLTKWWWKPTPMLSAGTNPAGFGSLRWPLRSASLFSASKRPDPSRH